MSNKANVRRKSQRSARRRKGACARRKAIEKREHAAHERRIASARAVHEAERKVYYTAFMTETLGSMSTRIWPR